MKVLCLLLVSGLALTYALPPTYRAGPVQMFDDDEDVDDDAEIDDDVDGDNNDMYTFGTGGPGGPPSNMYMDGPQGRSDSSEGIVSQLSNVFYASEKDIPEGIFFTYDNDKSDSAPALLPQGRKEKVEEADEDKKEDDKEEAEDEEEQEDAEESKEDQEDEEEDNEGDDAEQDDDSEGFSVPDMNKLFPNPNNLPVGPGSYNNYMQHLPKNKQQPGQGGEQPGRGYILPPQNRYASSGYQGRVPVPLATKPAARRFRSEVPLLTKLGGFVQVQDDDSIIVDAAPIMYRAEEQEDNMVDEDADAEDDAEDSQEDEEEADDDVDFSVPSFDTLFPQPSAQATPSFHGGMKNSWNNAPKPPSQQDRGRILRLFHSPLHDDYNPEYVIDPTEALNRRNQRLRHRYSGPNWRLQNVKTPYNYKPLLYQQGHYGNPREYDVHPQSGHIYSGGIYSGKHYV